MTPRLKLAIGVAAFLIALAGINHLSSPQPTPAQPEVAAPNATPQSQPQAAAPSAAPRKLGELEPETEIYETAQLLVDGTGWHISGEGKPAGIYLRYRLDPSKRYAVTIKGQQDKTRINMRVRRDGSDAEYLDAPSGSETLEMEAVANLELLFYAETAFTYHLQEITIVPVGDAAHVSAAELPAALAPILSGLKPRLEIYGAGAIARKTNIAAMWNPAATGGLITTYDLDPNKRYELRVTGAPRRLSASMRLRINAGEAEYLNAPDGAWNRVIENASQLELMLYADVNYAYSLESISLHPCDVCAGDPNTPTEGITEAAAMRLQQIAAGWSASLAGTALVDRSGNGVLLKTADSSGLVLQRDLPAGDRMLIKYRGASLGAVRPSLRIKLGNGPAQYFAMEDGPGQVMISGPGPVEALIYQEQGIAYRLEEFASDVCTDCIANKPRGALNIVAVAGSPDAIAIASPALGQNHHWHISSDVDATISAQSDGSIAITSEGDAQGVHFTQLMLPTARHRLKVQAANTSGRQLLRLRQEGKPTVWHLLDGSELDLLISDTRYIEVMIYGDAGSASVLRKLSLEPCANCASDDDLRAMIISALPGLEEELRSEPQAAARRILDWISNRADYALSPEVEEASGKLPYRLWSAGQIYYELFRPNKAAFYCGGLAEFGAKVFRLFGLRASTISFGATNSALTHSSILLRFGEGSTTDFYFFDPTFNIVFRKHEGDPVGLGGMLAKGGTNRLTAPQGRLDRDYIVLSKAVPRACKSTRPVDDQRLFCELDTPPTLDHYLRANARDFKSHKLQPDIRGFVQLLRLGVSSIDSDPATDDRDALIAMLKRNGIRAPG